LTKAELMATGSSRRIAERLPERFRQSIPGMFMRGDIQEISDFTLQAHLGMESISEWWKEKAEKRRRKSGDR
jgi:hypothetical protein